MSFNTVLLGTSKGSNLVLARREMFDIRTQLMAEDEDCGEQDHGALIAGLEEGDLKPNFYEGGFKTWECSLDLAKFVVDEDEDLVDVSSSRDDYGVVEDFHFIEVSS